MLVVLEFVIEIALCVHPLNLFGLITLQWYASTIRCSIFEYNVVALLFHVLVNVDHHPISKKKKRAGRTAKRKMCFFTTLIRDTM